MAARHHAILSNPIRAIVSLGSVRTGRHMLEQARKSLLGEALARPDFVCQVIARAQGKGTLEARRKPMEELQEGK